MSPADQEAILDHVVGDLKGFTLYDHPYHSHRVHNDPRVIFVEYKSKRLDITMGIKEGKLIFNVKVIDRMKAHEDLCEKLEIDNATYMTDIDTHFSLDDPNSIQEAIDRLQKMVEWDLKYRTWLEWIKQKLRFLRS